MNKIIMSIMTDNESDILLVGQMELRLYDTIQVVRLDHSVQANEYEIQTLSSYLVNSMTQVPDLTLSHDLSNNMWELDSDALIMTTPYPQYVLFMIREHLGLVTL